MTNECGKDRALRRVKTGLAALATFARIREELILKRMTTPAGASRECLEQMLRLNQETMDEARKGLWRAEDDLLREIGDAGW
jgi:hypothetical protein